MATGNSDSDSMADDAVIASMGVMQRSSPAMFARRRRILHEARRLMVERGAQGMGMRELAERADVSLRTLYNAFGSKEAIIAAAVRQYYDKFLRSLSEGRDIYSLDWVISGVVATNLRNQQIRDYLTSLVSLYFSCSADPAIRIELRRTASGFMCPWLELLQARRQLRPGTDITRATGHIASLQYAINQEWLGGAIPDEAFVPAVVEAVLIYLAGFLRGDALDAVDKEILDLSRGGARLERIICSEKHTISKMLDSPSGFWPVDAPQR